MSGATGAYSPFKILYHVDKIADLREGRQPVPAHVQFILSDLCNEDCNFCAYRMSGYTSNQLFGITDPVTARINNNPNRMIPYDKCLEVIDDCAEMGVKAIQFTGGGEPTVHPRHVDILNYALDAGIDIALVSNGVLFRDGLIDVLRRATWVRFSLDAGRAITYGRTRRVGQEIFAKVIHNIQSLVYTRTPSDPVTIGIGFVITKDNWEEAHLAASMAREIGVDNIRLSAVFQPDNEMYFADFYDSAAELCRSAESLSGDGFVVYNNFGDRVSDLRQQNPDYSFCGYQHLTTYIGGDQNVYRCCVYSYNERGLIGSIKNQRFADLWQSQNKRENFDSFDARGCERCQFNDKNRAILSAIQQPTHPNFV